MPSESSGTVDPYYDHIERKPMPNLQGTLAFVKIALAGQYDKSGQPMFDHARRVAEIAERLSDDPEIVHVALLHDVLEDTSATANDLTAMGYSARVVDAVKLLTHDTTKDSYVQYVGKIARSGNRLAIITKLADNFDNSRPDRHLELDTKTSREFLERYELARQVLTGTEPTRI